MGRVAIRVEGISKSYRVGASVPYHTLQESIIGVLRKPFSGLKPGWAQDGGSPGTYWALKDVTFDVHEGDVVGIIGMNGAGKSTLLKVLSKIIQPTEGNADIYGRVGSLLEVGTGFHPELTGRENVYFSGALLGMKRPEIRAKFDEIVEFSEVGKFIDTPMKHYSSGMQVRLAFSVAAHLEPEILLIDEVLAVGDITFQKKCLGKMSDISGQGRTILFVSHNMGAVLDLCNKGVLLSGGKVVEIGETRSVIDTYVKLCTKMIGDVKISSNDSRYHSELKFTAIRIVGPDHQPTAMVDLDGSYTLEIEYEIFQPVKMGTVMFELWGVAGSCIFASVDLDSNPMQLRDTREKGLYLARCPIPVNMLRPGAYWINLISDIPHVRYLDVVQNAISFEVNGLNVENMLSNGRRGFIVPVLRWETSKIR